MSGSIVLSGNGQTMRGDGPGETVLSASGNFDVILITGGPSGGGVRDLQIDATNMTSGNAINISNANRVQLENLIVTNPYNFLYDQQTNDVALREVWVNNVRGAYMVDWYGSASLRSDVLRMIGVTMSGNSTSRPTGILCDGNANTLELKAVNIVNPGIGLKTQNTAGAGAPAFLLSEGLQIDFPTQQAMWLSAGADFWGENVYLQGSAGSHGLQIDSGVLRVQMTSGKIFGNHENGVLDNGGNVTIGADVIDNSQAGQGLYPGVEAGSSASGLIVRGKVGASFGASSMQSYGVIADSGAASISVGPGDLTGNLYAGFQDDSRLGNGNVAQIGNAGVQFAISNNVGFTTQQGQGGQVTTAVSGDVLTATVANGGRWYSAAPSVTLVGGSCAGASISPVVTDGVITSLTVTGGSCSSSSAPDAVIVPQTTSPILRAYSAVAGAASNMSVYAQGSGGVFFGNDYGSYAHMYDSYAGFGTSAQVNGSYGGVGFGCASNFSTAGDCQTAKAELSASGTGSGTLRLSTSRNGTGNGGTSLPLANNSAMSLSCSVIVRNTSTGDAANFALDRALFTRGASASATALVYGSWASRGATSGASGVSMASLAADTTNGSPNITVNIPSGSWRAVADCEPTYVQ